jgi:hypothetical protein
VLESEFGHAVSIALDNAAPLACVATIVTMLVGCVVCDISARRLGADFSLGRLEKVELDRALVLYGKVFDRLHDIRSEAEQPCSTLLARYRLRRQVRRKFASELRDLQTYAAHMRATIVALQRKPLDRFRSWLHLDNRSAVESESAGMRPSSMPARIVVLGMLATQAGADQVIPLPERYLIMGRLRSNQRNRCHRSTPIRATSRTAQASPGITVRMGATQNLQQRL